MTINVWGGDGVNAFAIPLESATPADTGLAGQTLVWNPVTQVLEWQQQTAANNVYTPTAPMLATNMQAAIDELTTGNLGASRVTADDGASGSIWTTVQGFINKILSSVGSSLVGFIQSGTGAVATTVQAKLRESVSVKDFGAVGDGVTDDTAAIQAAFDYAQALGWVCIYFPKGEYRISGQININQYGSLDGLIDIFGAGPHASRIVCYGIFNAVFNLGNTTNQITRGRISDLHLGGNSSVSTVQYGIYGSRVDNWTFDRVWARYFYSAGISVGYGWSNNFNDCELSYNHGHGLRLNTDYSTGGNNGATLTGCKLFLNDQFGLHVTSGYGLVVNGGVIEANKFGGAYLRNVNGFKISTYFEANAATGYTFTTPAVAVRADIIFNGAANDTSMSSAFACNSGVVAGSFTSPTAGNTAFIYNAGVSNLSLDGIYNNVSSVPLLAEQYDSQYKGRGARIKNCSTFTTKKLTQSAVSNKDNTNAAYFGDDETERINYSYTPVSRWTIFSAGSASTLNNTALKHKGMAVWNINSTAAGTSNGFGYVVTATDFPELVGREVWFGSFVKCSDSSCFAVPYTSVQTFTSSATTLNEFVFKAVSFTWPSAGTVTLGMFKTGANTGDVYFTDPMLCAAGVPLEEAIGIDKSQYIYGSATFDPANLVDGAGETTTVTVTGAALGDYASASFSLDLQGVTVTAWVSAANTVSVRFQNETGVALDLASGTLRAMVQKQ